jgi:hypothetical protein
MPNKKSLQTDAQSPPRIGSRHGASSQKTFKNIEKPWGMMYKIIACPDCNREGKTIKIHMSHGKVLQRFHSPVSGEKKYFGQWGNGHTNEHARLTR